MFRRFCQEDVAGNGDVFGNGRTAFHAQFIRYDAFVHSAFDEVVIFAVVDDDLVNMLAYSMALRMKSEFST